MTPAGAYPEMLRQGRQAAVRQRTAHGRLRQHAGHAGHADAAVLLGARHTNAGILLKSRRTAPTAKLLRASDGRYRRLAYGGAWLQQPGARCHERGTRVTRPNNSHCQLHWLLLRVLFLPLLLLLLHG
eukprot:357678-Chlamydomonas_euryale.AAC.9